MQGDAWATEAAPVDGQAAAELGQDYLDWAALAARWGALPPADPVERILLALVAAINAYYGRR